MSNFWLGLAGGVFIGTLLGSIVAALLAANRLERERQEAFDQGLDEGARILSSAIKSRKLINLRTGAVREER